jgi:tetratricopeptide (TPR) repeat protein/thiol-disulfide isomerase/thioredoxin
VLGWRALYEFARSGRSFSGFERHCFFLNLGGRRFGDVSASSGLDFLDDGRGTAICDWDQDGALDVWFVNRTGPRVRFARNRGESGNAFVALRLVGTRSNRDAIGARVEVELAGAAPRVLARTLRAGEGFLSQSSKWVHVGLGASSDAAIAALSVRWPDGEKESFRGVTPGGRFVLEEGTGVARPSSSERPAVTLRAEELDPLPVTERSRVVLAAPMLLPTLAYRTAEGIETRIPDRPGRPLVINLWASWCANCVTEMSELGRMRAELEERGIEMLALSIDAPDAHPAAARALERVSWPYASGYLDETGISVVGLQLRALLDLHDELPVPTTLVVDPEGCVTVIYKGPIPLATLVDDAVELPSDPRARRAAATPFEGRWVGAPEMPPWFDLVDRLLEQDHVAVAADYVERLAGRAAPESLAPTSAFGSALQDARLRVAEGLMRLGRHEEASAAYRALLAHFPENAALHDRFAGSLFALGRLAEAEEVWAEAAARFPDDPLLAAGIGRARMRAGSTREARSWLERALTLDPRCAEALRGLAELDASVGEERAALARFVAAAISLREAGRFGEADEVIERGLALAPDDERLLYEAGLLQAQSGEPERARRTLAHLERLRSSLAAELAAALAH